MAPLVTDGAVTGDLSRAWVGTRPAPELKPGWVVMDNLPAHKVAGVREAVEAARLLYLPPYSPGLNAIELAFSKLERLPAGPPSARARGWGTASGVCPTSSPRECRNYFRHCGYRDRLIRILLINCLFGVPQRHTVLIRSGSDTTRPRASVAAASSAA